jgi:hypothetical protein
LVSGILLLGVVATIAGRHRHAEEQSDDLVTVGGPR